MAYVVHRRGYDNFNSGVNPHETILTADAVAARGIKKVHTVNIPNDARGCEAATLIAPNITVAGQPRNLAIAATLANEILAHDEATGELLWTCKLGTPVNKSGAIDGWEINDHWGVLSTPVLDSPTAPTTLYCCYWASPDGSVAKAEYWFAAVSLATGKLVRPSLNLEGAFYEPSGAPVQRFRNASRKQRASLTIALSPQFSRGIVFIPFGSIFESRSTNQGWVVAVDVARWQISAARSMVVKGHGAGIWQAGGGLALDASGYLYGMTANGSFDPEQGDFGEAVVKLTYSPGVMLGELRVVDWFSPWLDSTRGSTAGTREQGQHEPTNIRSALMNLPPPLASGDVPLGHAVAIDMDLGSGTPVLVPELGVAVVCGKDGVCYLVRMGNMGATTLEMLSTPQGVLANYRDSLAAPPFHLTYYPGPKVNPAPADIRDLNFLFGGRSHHQHGSPIVWSSPHGVRLLCWGENSTLRAFRLQGEPSPAPGIVRASQHFLAAGNEYASVEAPVPPGGMPGGMMSLSWDGKDPRTAVLWGTIPYGDANTEITKGRLLAYRLDQLDEGKLPVIWDSQRWNWDFEFVKFTPPVVANGYLHLPSYDARRFGCTLA